MTGPGQGPAERRGPAARTVRCPGCGAEGEGNFCARCGTRLRREGVTCPTCGSGAASDALYCSDCGAPVAPPGRKPVRAYLPWVFAALSLVAFSAALAIFVQGQSGPRGADGLITGGLPEPTGAPADVIPAPGAGGGAPGGAAAPGMAGAPDISSMSPREAADRLFDRSMAEEEAGNQERAAFFADMGLQAYERLPPEQLDADARFHVGLLHLLLDDPARARAQADALLSRRPTDLFGLVLGLRAAEAAGDGPAARRWGARLLAAVEGGERPDRDPYAPHRGMLERELERAASF